MSETQTLRGELETLYRKYGAVYAEEPLNREQTLESCLRKIVKHHRPKLLDAPELDEAITEARTLLGEE